jgi:hypothetical protein
MGDRSAVSMGDRSVASMGDRSAVSMGDRSVVSMGDRSAVSARDVLNSPWYKPFVWSNVAAAPRSLPSRQAQRQGGHRPGAARLRHGKEAAAD